MNRLLTSKCTSYASEELEKLEGRKEVLKERKKNAAQNKEQLKSNIAELTEQRSANLETKTRNAGSVKLLRTRSKNYYKHSLKEKQEKLSLFMKILMKKLNH